MALLGALQTYLLCMCIIHFYYCLRVKFISIFSGIKLRAFKFYLGSNEAMTTGIVVKLLTSVM